MDPASLKLPVDRLFAGCADWDGPLAFVDLEAVRDWPERIVLPPFPVIGLGDPGHPLAAQLDAMIAAPVSAESVSRQVAAHPRAAAVIVGLLRLLPGLTPEDGLTAESLAYGVLQAGDEHRAWLAGRSGAHDADRQIRMEREGDRLTITLDDPASGNAIDRAMRDALHEAFELAALDTDLRVSLRGAGRTFSLGAELGEFGTTTDPALAHAIRMRTLPARMIARCADRLDVHAQGGCVGAGLEMAAWAQRFTAAPDAWFQLPELAMGVLPGAGGCVSLTRRIGRQKAALLILSGKRINVRTALGWGLVDEIVDQPA